VQDGQPLSTVLQNAEEVCCLSSVPDRALQMLKLTDTSHALKAVVYEGYDYRWYALRKVVNFEGFPSSIALTRDFVSIVSTVAYRFKHTKLQGSLPSALQYIADASETSIAELDGMLKPMAAREQQLTSLIQQCSDDAAVVEAALQYKTLLKEAREFVFNNELKQLTLGDVVDLVKRVAEEEQVAIQMWAPGHLAWWQASEENRNKGRAACCDRSFGFVSGLTRRATGAETVHSCGRPDFAVAISMADIRIAVSDSHFIIDEADVHKKLLNDRVAGPANVALNNNKGRDVGYFLLLRALRLNESQISFVMSTDAAIAAPPQLALELKKVVESARLIFSPVLYRFQTEQSRSKMEAVIAEPQMAQPVREFAKECLALHCKQVQDMVTRCMARVVEEFKLRCGDLSTEEGADNSPLAAMQAFLRMPCATAVLGDASLRSYILDVMIMPIDALEAGLQHVIRDLATSLTNDHCGASIALAVKHIVFQSAIIRRRLSYYAWPEDVLSPPGKWVGAAIPTCTAIPVEENLD
jgi:hypothetical protein